MRKTGYSVRQRLLGRGESGKAPAKVGRKVSAMTIGDRDKPGNPTKNDAPVAVVDAADAETGAEEEDVFASEEVEIAREDVDFPQDDDDDNPYQESDEALPDDREEAAIRRDLENPDNIDRRP